MEISLFQGANGVTRGHRHMLESGKSQLGTETHLFIYVHMKVIKHWSGAWSSWAISFSVESPNSGGWL